jgi:chemotaxis protein MotB
MNRLICWMLVILGIVSFSGCTFVLQKGRRSDVTKIEQLTKQLDELEKARLLLEQSLKDEIADKQVSLERAEKGLVIKFVADVLFDSGQAKIRTGAYTTLDKVAKVLADNVPQNEIGIEGHTDNEPIKYSGWKSNWELSTARALSVLHYLVDEKKISPFRVSAIGYGEYRAVASNDTKQGRQANRRVEIVILPKITKMKEIAEQPEVTQEAEVIEEPVEKMK